jgi:hypothetical protein
MTTPKGKFETGERVGFDGMIKFRCAPALGAAADAAAANTMLSRSDYVRSALLARLRSDGIEPAQFAA